MQRPPSIILYERLYLAAFVLGLASTALGWSAREAMQAGNPIVANITWLLPASTVLGIALSLVLWYFTARSPSVIAKWVVVFFGAFAILGIVLNLVALATGRAPSLAAAAVSLIASGLYAAAAALLFRPDAKTWFGEEGFADHERSE